MAMLLGRLKATRYKVGKDADDLGAVSASTQPAVCLVFSKEPKGGKKARRKKKAAGEMAPADVEKERWVGIIRAVGLQVAASASNDGQKWFLQVSAPEAVLRYQAEQMKLKLRVKKIYGGGLYKFQRRLIELYDQSSEGDLFPSLAQLQIIDAILQTKREDGGAEMDYSKLIEDESSSFAMMFYLHHESARKQLEVNWARFSSYKKAQPLELIREYFGEKIALYFCWIGFYTQMLWIPAMVGMMVMVSQAYTQIFTGSLDNPWVPLYCCFTALWTVTYIEGWKRLENQKKLEWDTSSFEEQEEDRAEFKKTHTRIDPIKREEERYFPTFIRRARICGTSAVVCGFISVVVVVVCQIMSWKFQMTNSLGMVGTILGGILNAASIMIFNTIYDKVVGPLTDWENWRTDTEYEDAMIAKDFCFKFVNAYFALFFVAFIQNYVPIFGSDLHCPDYECMPVLTSTLAVVFATQMFVQQTVEVCTPMFYAWQARVAAEKKMMKEGKPPAPLSNEEQQALLPEYEGVFDDYNEMVVQFGYVALFAAAFPLTATLALLNNIVEIRVDAMKVLLQSQRAQYRCAADIGTWMSILEILATIAIMTNVCLVGFTSHGLYYYFPDLDTMDKIWTVVISEHVLLFIKIVVQALIDDVAAEVQEDADVAKHKLDTAINTLKVEVAKRAEQEKQQEEQGSDFEGSDEEDARK